MAYNGLTNAGAAYLAARQANNLPVEFLKAKVGNGIVSGGTDPAELTDIISEKMEIEISDIQQAERTLKMTVQVSNENLTTGFQLTEIAIYVNDNGTAVLYWYIGKDNGTYVPDSTKPMKYKNILNIEVSSTPITTVNYTGKDLWVDKETLDKELDKKLDTSIYTGSESVAFIQDTGTKTVGSIYFDKDVTPYTPYYCISTNTDTTVTSNFITASNKDLARRTRKIAVSVLYNGGTVLVNGTTSAAISFGTYQFLVVRVRRGQVDLHSNIVYQYMAGRLYVEGGGILLINSNGTITVENNGVSSAYTGIVEVQGWSFGPWL